VQETAGSIPYWRLSGFYFFYFSVLGAMVPYWGLYLDSLGFGPEAIGTLGAILMGTKLLAPNLWGWLADRSGQRLRIIQLGSLLALVLFWGVLDNSQFASMALFIAGFSFFWNAVLPQFEVITLGYLQKVPHIYSRIRMWGSIGFIVAVLILGLIFDYLSLHYLPHFICLCLGLIWLSSLTVKNTGRLAPQRTRGRFVDSLKLTPVWAFFLVCFLMQVAHGPYYTFFSVYLEHQGYSTGAIGALWALGVLAEVVLFLVIPRWLPAWGVRKIILLSLLLAALRWLLIGLYPEQLWVLLVVQLLHAFTFGAFHTVAIEMVRVFFDGGSEGQGQAFYSSVSFGAGGALGAFLSGYSWDWSPMLTFLAASLVSVMAFFLALWLVKGDKVT